MQKLTSAILVSGGSDSAILTTHLLKKYPSVLPIYVRSGHIWEDAELFWLKHFLRAIRNPRIKALKVLSLETRDLYQNHWSITGKKIPGAKSHDEKVYLPGKNLLLISKAAVFCSLTKIPYLALAPLKTNPFPDAHPSFFKSIEKTCSKGLNFKLRMLTPFLNKSKQEVMKLGRNLPLELTFSCLAPQTVKGLTHRYIHCGRCNKCAERKKAFRNAKLIDRTYYAN